MAVIQQNERWSTVDELRHLKFLGQWAIKPGRLDLNERLERRKMLLNKYIEAAKTRYDWGKINKRIVIDATERALRSLSV